METRHTTDRKSASGHARRRGPHISLDRRLHPRLPAVDYRVWIGGWRSGGAAFETVAARLEDISRGGARVVSPLAFAEGQEVWLRLASPAYAGCVRAEVLEVSTLAGGDHAARLQFREECPRPFFDIATRGGFA